MCVVSQNQLFEIKHSSFVRNSLPDLHLRHPSVRSVRNLAVITLLIRHIELDHESLLQHGVRLNFFLDCDLNLDSSRVGLSPDKRSVKQLDAL
jgi:hypothetical protein